MLIMIYILLDRFICFNNFFFIFWLKSPEFDAKIYVMVCFYIFNCHFHLFCTSFSLDMMACAQLIRGK